ncbi:MAG: 4-(cytidine 5'-diphospho)-2-C-methyl-D-erythritol kinase, partial [Pseudomonadota bacterium]
LWPPDQVQAFVDWLRRQRNDLEAPARRLVPEIGAALDALAALPGCLLARMSGSGATCFGLFETGAATEQVNRIKRDHPGWWVAETALS